MSEDVQPTVVAAKARVEETREGSSPGVQSLRSVFSEEGQSRDTFGTLPPSRPRDHLSGVPGFLPDQGCVGCSPSERAWRTSLERVAIGRRCRHCQGLGRTDQVQDMRTFFLARGNGKPPQIQERYKRMRAHLFSVLNLILASKSRNRFMELECFFLW